MVKKVPLIWTKNLKTDQEKENFTNLLTNSTIIIGRLKELIEEQSSNLNKTAFSIEDFSDPNWSHKQAFRNGKLAGLKEILDILTIGRP